MRGNTVCAHQVAVTHWQQSWRDVGACGCQDVLQRWQSCFDATHTGPNFRVPLTKQTHDPDCTADCADEEKSQLLTAIAYRAMRNTTGYYIGYMQKKQPVGKFELQQAMQNLKFLQEKLQNKSNAAQYHNLANCMLGDLEFRGHLRPITEEFNLAANYHHHDVLNAEFYAPSMVKHSSALAS